MKKMMIALLWIFSCIISQAQGIGSFFTQKQTQRKYYLDQIAALQLQIGYVKSGYKATGKGLSLISGFKKGELDLHGNYYNSLKQVNPAIQNSEAVKEIYRLAAAIRTTFTKSIAEIAAKKTMPDKEMKYIRSVYDNLDRKLGQDIEELSLVITPGRLQLSDDERWKRVKAIQAEVEDKYTFTLSFTGKAKFVAEQRKRELDNINRMKKIHNIKD